MGEKQRRERERSEVRCQRSEVRRTEVRNQRTEVSLSAEVKRRRKFRNQPFRKQSGFGMPLALVLYQLKDVGKGLFRFDVDRQRLQFAETLVRPLALFQVQVYVQAVNVFVILPGKIKSHFEKTLPHGNPAHGLLLIYELAEPRLPVIVE